MSAGVGLATAAEFAVRAFMAFTHSARVDLDAVDTASELVPVVGVEDDLRWQPAVGAQDRHLAADLVVGGVPHGRAPDCGREARPFRSAIPAGAEQIGRAHV